MHQASKHSIETTSINGGMSTEIRLHPSWKDDYQAYLARYKAEHKDEAQQRVS
jgi:hypothetical protein